MSVFLRDIQTELEAKGLDNGIPVGGVYAGLVPNSQETLLSGSFTLQGDLTGLITLEAPTKIGASSLILGLYNQGEQPWQIRVYKDDTDGLLQARIDVKRNGVLVGRLIMALIVLDLAKANVEDLNKPPVFNGAPQLLQVQATDYVTVTP